MKYQLNLCLVLWPAALLAFAGCSSTSNDPKVHGTVMIDTTTATATVESIDAARREVTLRRPDGSHTVYECGPDIINFDQIRVGDQVSATVAEELALMLVKGGSPSGAGTSTAVVRNPKGSMPGGKVIQADGFVARVLAVDQAKREVTLQMVDGHSKTVKVSKDIKLTNVKPGDDVGVRLTRSVAVSVERPEPAK